MTFRSRRLEELFGGTLDAITYADIAALVGNPDAAEAEDLDYKQAHYTSEPKSREELAKDVAAFANHVGGVIIIGMAENRGVPSMVFDVALDDSHLRDLQQRIASSTAPPVRWHHVTKDNPANPGNGFLLIAVSRSPQAPHAITVPPVKAATTTLRYPRRGGTTTEWLTETYVATAYHQRFADLSGRQDRMKEIQQELVAQEAGRNAPHLIVTLVPDVPGDLLINQESFERYRRELLETRPLLGQDTQAFRAVHVQARRLMLHNPDLRTPSDLAYVFTDGSGIWAQPLPKSFDEDEDPAERVLTTPADLVVHRLMSALAFLGAHARDRCGSTGTCRMEVDLVDRMYSHSYAPPEPLVRPGQQPPPHLYPLHLEQLQPYPNGAFVCPAASAEGTGFLDSLADAGSGLIEAASLLADQLFHSFGIAEASPLTSDGALRPEAWDLPLRAAITQWADKHSVRQTGP
ncbi:AlbA family DNA-binding domain-containing protein [Streptomyces hydrogenans]|uniref:AlbA family DNA-binding domain-containing protein n=1 Tax=Streptomyces hydrogenans TaxID=1873719 RepID=UPI0035DAA8D5